MIAAMMTGTGELAKIFLKNGKQRTGVLLNDVNNPDSFDNGVQFVSHDNIGNFLSNPDNSLIEIYQADAVEGIDIYMK